MNPSNTKIQLDNEYGKPLKSNRNSAAEKERMNKNHFSSQNKSKTLTSFLDYTFVSHRSNLSSETAKNSNKSKEYLYDLTNTWELNLDIMGAMIKDLKTETRQNVDLLEIVQRIKKGFEKKKLLKDNILKIKSKHLIEKQIIEEHKRKVEENGEYYKDQISEFEENRQNKEEYLKIFEKKLKEVEIYIQKNSKFLTNSKYEVYKDFKISPFIEANTELVKKKETLKKEILNFKGLKQQIEEENLAYKNDKTHMSFYANTEGPEALTLQNNEDAKPKNSEKLRQYYHVCQNKVRVAEMRMQLMKNYFKEISTKLNFFDISELKKYVNREKQDMHQILLNNFDVDGEELNVKEQDPLNKENVNDKSAINLDITRKIATFMDFSVILNKKQNNDETNIDFGLNKTGLGNVANDLWDISCIGKN